jgi:predicted outer membrane protein
MDPKQQNNIPSSREIVDALGGMPMPVLHKPRPVWPIFLGIAIFLFAAASLILVFALPDADTSETTTSESTIVKPSETTEAYREIADSASTIISFTSNMKEKNYNSAATMFHDDSIIKAQGVTESIIQDYSGPNIAWDTCLVIEQETYRAATLKVTENKTYQIQYIPVLCSTLSGEIRSLEFDMRHVNGEQTKIFDIIARVL